MCVDVSVWVWVWIYIYVMYNIHSMVGRSIADVYSRSATFTEAQVLRYEHLPYTRYFLCIVFTVKEQLRNRP